MGFGLSKPAGPCPTGARVLGGRAETTGSERPRWPWPGWGEGKEVCVGG